MFLLRKASKAVIFRPAPNDGRRVGKRLKRKEASLGLADRFAVAICRRWVCRGGDGRRFGLGIRRPITDFQFKNSRAKGAVRGGSPADEFEPKNTVHAHPVRLKRDNDFGCGAFRFSTHPGYRRSEPGRAGV